MKPYISFFPFLSKVALIGPCYVTANSGVSDAALLEAGHTLGKMLSHRPDVVENLRAHGTITAVFGKDESVYDLEYFSDLRDKPQALGGLGGTVVRPVTGVSERNLLKSPDDPYGRGSSLYGANVSVHELAHTIMNVGLPQSEIAKIRFRHREAISGGLWKNDWASTNFMEFFAELSQIYFYAQCTRKNDLHLGINGPDALKGYDPESFRLIQSVYRGSTDLK